MSWSVLTLVILALLAGGDESPPQAVNRDAAMSGRMTDFKIHSGETFEEDQSIGRGSEIKNCFTVATLSKFVRLCYRGKCFVAEGYFLGSLAF